MASGEEEMRQDCDPWVSNSQCQQTLACPKRENFVHFLQLSQKFCHRMHIFFFVTGFAGSMNVCCYENLELLSFSLGRGLVQSSQRLKSPRPQRKSWCWK